MGSPDDLTIAHRLRVLRSAESLGSVTEACRRAGISRATFYAWRRRSESGGDDALADRRRGRRREGPRKVDARARATILGLATARPWLGCSRIASLLRERGIDLSYQSVHQVLRSAGLSRRRQREERLERNVYFEAAKLGPQRRRLLTRSNPCAELLTSLLHSPGRPGQVVVIDVVPLWGDLAAILAVDWYSTFAWARVARRTLPTEADTLLSRVEQDLPTPRPGTVRQLHLPQTAPFRRFARALEPRPWKLVVKLYHRERAEGRHPWIQRVVAGARLRDPQPTTADQDPSPELQYRIDAYNRAFTTGRFPDWGFTPDERLPAE